MKTNFISLLALLLCLTLTMPGLQGQNKSDRTDAAKNHPSSFLISRADLNNLLKLKVHEVISNKNNKYLDGSIVMANTKNGDMQYLRLRLAAFRKAYLNVQVNGSSSTQVFIVSDDKSVFYKGRMESQNVVMIKCTEDEIISE